MKKTDMINRLFVRMSGLTLCSEDSLQEFDLARVGGAFVVHRVDALTNTTLTTWAIGEIRERKIVAKRRFALIKLLPGGGMAAVSTHGCLVEALNALNNTLESYGICRRFTMEDLARLS